MRLMVTRPEQDSLTLKTRLVAQGHEVLIEPLISIDFSDPEAIEIDGVQALIATSRNGLRALAQSPALDRARELPVFCVGPGTAATAKAIGLQRIIEGPRAARELVVRISEEAEINGGPLVHLAGDHVTPVLADELQRLGYHVLQPMVYATRVAQRLSSPTVAHLRNGRIGGVLLLSPRTAEVYAGLIRQHNLVEASRRIQHICLSPAVARALTGLPAVKVSVAKAPNLQELLALTASGAAQL